jgi:hypothetical protein
MWISGEEVNNFNKQIDKLKTGKQDKLDPLELRRMIGKELVNCFNGRPDDPGADYWRVYDESLFITTLKRIIKPSVESAIKAIVENEEFIDKIVERIKRKQLS